jgi:glycosyltransferase involved in cell wall biosynthesis
MMPTPSASVGLPVYNGAASVAAAIDSVLGQTWTDFELIVSDNGSTDGTESICRAYAERDPRVRYHRQPTNRGADFNFRFVLEASTGEFFMWNAADDARSPDFLALNVGFLREHPDYVASCCPVKFAGRPRNAARMGDAPLDGTLPERVKGMLRGGIHANGRFYSLLRRAAITNSPFFGRDFLADDWAVVLHLASQGKLHRVDAGWTELGTQGASGGPDLFRLKRHRPRDFWLPFGTFAEVVWTYAQPFPAKDRAALALALARLNLYGFIGQAFLPLRKLRKR